MSSFSPQLGDNNQPNKNNFEQLFLLLYIALNGFSTGNLIRTGRDIVNNGTDDDTIISALLWLGCTLYTAQRAYELYKKIHKNDKDNTNQR